MYLHPQISLYLQHYQGHTIYCLCYLARSVLPKGNDLYSPELNSVFHSLARWPSWPSWLRSHCNLRYGRCAPPVIAWKAPYNGRGSAGMVARARETHVYLKYVHRLSYMFPPTIVERTINRISSISTSFTLTISPPGRLELMTSIQGLNCTSSNLVYSTQCSECVLLLDIGEMKDNPPAVALKGSPATISVSFNRIPSPAKYPLSL